MLPEECRPPDAPESPLAPPPSSRPPESSGIQAPVKIRQHLQPRRRAVNGRMISMEHIRFENSRFQTLYKRTAGLVFSLSAAWFLREQHLVFLFTEKTVWNLQRRLCELHRAFDVGELVSRFRTPVCGKTTEGTCVSRDGQHGNPKVGHQHVLGIFEHLVSILTES